MTPNTFVKERFAVSLWGSGIVVACIIAYSAYAAFPYLAGPNMTLNMQTSTDGTTTLYGETKRVAFLEINGTPITLEENGSYTVERAYPSGYTAIQATARDRFGRTITKTLTFIISNPAAHGAQEEN